YGGKAFKREDARNEIWRFCREMHEAVDRDAFPVFSTRRQFRRYVDDWPRQEWKDLAKAALEARGDGPSGAAKRCTRLPFPSESDADRAAGVHSFWAAGAGVGRASRHPSRTDR